jgi:hypothetical protein
VTSQLAGAQVDADMAAAVLAFLRGSPGREYTAHQIWGRLPGRYPLGAVAACLDTLYRAQRIQRRKTGHGRRYRLPAAAVGRIR